MFHTLTVESANKNNNNSLTALKIIYDYIKYFLDCDDCVKHFIEMSDRKRLFVQNNGDESILWLWEAHNEVNMRLSVDDSNKIQYPSHQSCPTYRESLNGAWNKSEVLKFLKAKYSIKKSNNNVNDINNNEINNSEKNYANNKKYNVVLILGNLILLYHLISRLYMF